jgi:hypothetical protein
MDQGVGAAKRRFPKHERAIEELAARDPEFTSLCIDLADAEAAALQWGASTSPKCDERRDEYLALADELANEIEMKLDKVIILALRRGRTEEKR